MHYNRERTNSREVSKMMWSTKEQAWRSIPGAWSTTRSQCLLFQASLTHGIEMLPYIFFSHPQNCDHTPWLKLTTFRNYNSCRKCNDESNKISGSESCRRINPLNYNACIYCFSKEGKSVLHPSKIILTSAFLLSVTMTFLLKVGH
jgi:hypothetical protein